MRHNRTATAGTVTLVAVVVGATAVGCGKSGSGGSQPTTTTAASSSSASSSPGKSTSPSPPAGKTAKASDGSFTVVLPDNLDVMPNDSQDENSGIFAAGKDKNTMFIAGVIPPEERGSTCRETVEKAGPEFAKEWNGTFEAGNIKSATVDGEPAWRSTLTFPSTPERPYDQRGEVLCVQHRDVQYGVFYGGPPESAEAEFDAIIGSWKWSA